MVGGTYSRNVVQRVGNFILQAKNSFVEKIPGSNKECLSWRTSQYVDCSHCDDDSIDLRDLQIFPNVITSSEETSILKECELTLARRRYERGHWDNVISNYKEIEKLKWSEENYNILNRVRQCPIFPENVDFLKAVHVIDLEKEGYIQPHVDSIKFSGDIVAGLSLLSSSILRFKREYGNSTIDVLLPPRSLYFTSGVIRYKYTHEILPGAQFFKGKKVERDRRISIIFRNVLNPQ